jgi:glycopeptide antibiotics resistance protein
MTVNAQHTDLKAAKRLNWAGHAMMGLIILGSILPLTWSAEGWFRWPMLLNWRDMQLTDILQNVAALVPVGIVYGASRDAETRWRNVAVVAICTVLLQLVQLWLPARTPRLTDAVANIFGVLLGLGFARATHAMRKFSSAPQPIELAILLLLLCYMLLLQLIEQGAGSAMDQWLMRSGIFASNHWLPTARMLVAGYVARALVAKQSRAIWLFLGICAICLAFGPDVANWQLAVAILAGGLIAQILPRRVALPVASIALVAILLWDGLTPWLPASRTMTWMPLKSLLMSASMAAFVTLAWKLFSWSSLALFLCSQLERGRTIIVCVAGLVASIEFAQMYIASGFPDITDILLAAGLSGLVVLTVQQSGQHLGHTP